MPFWNIFKKIKIETRPIDDSSYDKSEQADTSSLSSVDPTQTQSNTLINNSTPSKNGLFPHEILLISYICSQRANYLKEGATTFPKFWFYKYGVDDVQAVLQSLVARGFLQAEDGVYKPTKKGIEEEQYNGYVYYVHRFNDEIDPWEFNKIMQTVPSRIKNYSWKDKYWYWLNQNSVATRRNNLLSMARFRAYENNFIQAVEILDQVIELDKISGDFKEFHMGIPPGISKLRERWAKQIK